MLKWCLAPFLMTKVGKHGGEVTGDKEDANDDQKDPSDRGDDFKIFPDGFKVFEEFMNQDSGQEKGNTKA